MLSQLDNGITSLNQSRTLHRKQIEHVWLTIHYTFLNVCGS